MQSTHTTDVPVGSFLGGGWGQTPATLETPHQISIVQFQMLHSKLTVLISALRSLSVSSSCLSLSPISCWHCNCNKQRAKHNGYVSSKQHTDYLLRMGFDVSRSPKLHITHLSFCLQIFCSHVVELITESVGPTAMSLSNALQVTDLVCRLLTQVVQLLPIGNENTEWPTWRFTQNHKRPPTGYADWFTYLESVLQFLSKHCAFSLHLNHLLPAFFLVLGCKTNWFMLTLHFSPQTHVCQAIEVFHLTALRRQNKPPVHDHREQSSYAAFAGALQFWCPISTVTLSIIMRVKSFNMTTKNMSEFEQQKGLQDTDAGCLLLQFLQLLTGMV